MLFWKKKNSIGQCMVRIVTSRGQRGMIQIKSICRSLRRHSCLILPVYVTSVFLVLVLDIIRSPSHEIVPKTI